MLLGKPWFKKAKLKQGWGDNMVILIERKQILSLSMTSTITMQKQQRALWKQGIHLPDEVEDDEKKNY